MLYQFDGREFLQELYRTSVACVNPYRMVKDRIGLNGKFLEIQHNSEILKLSLLDYNQILIVGAGKASAPMANAFEEILEAPLNQGILSVEGLVSVKYGHTVPMRKIRLIEAAHPVPDENSFYAGDEIANLLETADERSLIINLISGGGSSLLVRLHPGLQMMEIQEMNQLLLDCGAGIHEINTLRKHTSRIKGGHLASLAYPGRLINIILSDVVGDDLEVIASGPGVPDPSSFEDVWTIINKYKLAEKLPASILEHFQRGKNDNTLETPSFGALCFRRVNTVLLGNNRLALAAAAAHAMNKGIESLVLSSRISGEAKEIGKMFAAIALDPPRQGLLLLAGGETTVTISGKGTGGRNQELALSYLNTVLESRMLPRAYFLAAGSDGNDGPTDAAGAIICPEDVSKLQNTMSPAPYLADNNAYSYLSEHDLLYKTGPTNTNVCDFFFLYLP